MKDLDTVALKHDIKEYGLKKGDIGAIVQIYEEGEAYEVEFVAANGKTVALLTLKPSDIRKVTGNEILNSRELNFSYSA